LASSSLMWASILLFGVYQVQSMVQVLIKAQVPHALVQVHRYKYKYRTRYRYRYRYHRALLLLSIIFLRNCN
jgi:hypothetical protein